MMQNEILSAYGSRWLVHQARSTEDALHAIAMACCSGSVGSKHMESRNGGEPIVIAEVSRAADAEVK